VTDRALRYRANACPPPGPRICAFCGSTRNVDVGHLDGFEENNSPSSLIWNCRSCNTRLGIIFKRWGIGRRTSQFNPVDTPEPRYMAYSTRTCQRCRRKNPPGRATNRGVSDVRRRSEAETSGTGRAEEKFYETEGRLRQFNPAQGATSLGQWLASVLSIKGESDAMSVPAAVETIRATSPEKRSAFANEIWHRRRQRGTDHRPRKGQEEPPF
jgi:hypothetical protein